MTAAQNFQAYAAIVQKHYNALRAAHGQVITKADHESMAKEAKRLANAEFKAA